MGIHSVNGQGPPVPTPANTARVPAPQLRASEGASETKLLAQQVQEPNKEQATQAARPVERETSILSSGVPRFRINKDTKQIIAQIVDEHNKVIRQIPPEELLRVAAKIRKLEGVLFDKST